MEQRLTHFDERGNAVMVDVTDKADTRREATARGSIAVNEAAFAAVRDGSKKGDVLNVARIAGIMAAKKTSELIPLCHPLAMTKCSVDFELHAETREIEAICTTVVTGQTGVEMEALTGATVALLTIYDMCKAVDRGMELKSVYLERKSGGRSGTFQNPRHAREEDEV